MTHRNFPAETEAWINGWVEQPDGSWTREGVDDLGYPLRARSPEEAVEIDNRLQQIEDDWDGDLYGDEHRLDARELGVGRY